MLRSLKALLSRTRTDDPQATQREIEQMERDARAAPLDRRGTLFNRAGDVCLREGYFERAVKNFGRAIDAYLESGHLDAAPSLCRKIIRLSPDVVRARSTLVAISLAEGMFKDAQQQISEYVRAAEAAERADIATQRLRLLAAATENEEVRMTIGEYLIELGSPTEADQVFGTVYAERNGLREQLPADEDERYGRLLAVALMGPRDMSDYKDLTPPG